MSVKTRGKIEDRPLFLKVTLGEERTPANVIRANCLGTLIVWVHSCILEKNEENIPLSKRNKSEK